jgi:hypothetical protein
MPASTSEEERKRVEEVESVVMEFSTQARKVVENIVTGKVKKDQSFGGIAGGDKFVVDVIDPWVKCVVLTWIFRVFSSNLFGIPLCMNQKQML